MSLMQVLLSEGVGAIFKGIGDFAKDLREAITGKAILDPNKQAEILMKVQEMEQALALAQAQYEKAQMEGQIAINLEEAKSASFFKSGWRPAVGWTCVGALNYTYLVKPLAPWIATTWANSWGRMSAAGPLPEVPMGDLIVLLLGMLGLAGMRTFEQVKGKR